MRMEARRADTWRRQGLVYDSRPHRGMPKKQGILKPVRRGGWLGVISSPARKHATLLSSRCHAIRCPQIYLKINEIGLKVFSFRTVLILNIGSINEKHDERIGSWQ